LLTGNMAAPVAPFAILDFPGNLVGAPVHVAGAYWHLYVRRAPARAGRHRPGRRRDAGPSCPTAGRVTA
jgi:hypothetical protein